MRNSATFMLFCCSIVTLSIADKIGATTPEQASTQNLTIRKYEFARCISMPIGESEIVIQDEQTRRSLFRMSPDCKMGYDASVDFNRWTLIGRRFTIPGGCSRGGNPFIIGVTQDNHSRVYRHTVTTGVGPCAGGANPQIWVLVPKLPTGYRVEFQQLRLSDSIMDCADSWDE